MVQLTALWALSEAVLGGALHGLKLPVTGLFVGGTAVLLVCLMGYYGNGKAGIFKATIIVCIIKAMLSPHSPMPAYLAVLFQGVVGSLLVSGRGWFTMRCVVFAVLALLESAMQKLLVLTLLFGVEFWEAVNQFVSKLLKQLGAGPGPYATYIVGVYLGLHVLAGFGIGLVAGRLPGLIERARLLQRNLLLAPDGGRDAMPKRNRPASRRVKPLLLGIWLILAILLAQAWLQPERAWLPAGEALGLIVRSAALLLAWYLIVGPMLLRFFKSWLDRKQGALKEDVQAVLTLMPSTLHLTRRCWQATTSERGLARMRSFARRLAVNLFAEHTYEPVR